MSIKPLKIDIDGEIKRFQDGDELSVEEKVRCIEALLNRLIIEMLCQGFKIKDPVLLQQLDIALKTIKI